jgi:cytochrome c oxidase subunit II
MSDEFRLFPEAASTVAHKTDALYIFLCWLTAFFTLLIFLLIVYFGLKNRRRSTAIPLYVPTNRPLEVVWTVVPLAITMIIYVWSAKIYFFIHRPPSDALQIHVIGKQWMWILQHPNGRRENNELHVPINLPVKLTLASEDVIHDFFIPAFRVKVDVVPGRYSKLWFQATKLGTYHLFCAEYCGKDHSRMVGRVIVMESQEYQTWLTGVPIAQTPAEAGAKLFTQLGCITCHGVQAPSLAGVYLSQVRLSDGRTVLADEQYLRDSILDSTKDVVAGYAPLMPSFRRQVSEEQLADLIAYIKSLQQPAEMKKVQ